MAKRPTDTIKADEMTVTFPAGNGIKYSYDENNVDPGKKGNLLEIRRKADMTVPDSDTADLVTTTAFQKSLKRL